LTTFSSHESAKASHYDHSAEDYDVFNEENSKQTNQTVESILEKYHVKTVLDLTCGTGSQVFWLNKRGYEVTGSDINGNMLKVARRKAAAEALDIPFHEGDMRTSHLGQFDAVITIYHAIGHLSKDDLETAMVNIHKNLKAGGIYIFDIFNLNYLLEGHNIAKLTMDQTEVNGNIKSRDIQYSTINENGVLASFTTTFIQEGASLPRRLMCSQTMQVYHVKQLEEMLQRSGFEPLEPCAIDGTEFSETQSERIVMVARSFQMSWPPKNRTLA
jgi:ubiquinone/menaquinone biosynthesis C-methylase UbiE